MKKILLFVLAIGVGFATYAQTVHQPVSTHLPATELQMEPAPSNNTSDFSDEQVADLEGLKNTAASFVQIGTTGNAYGFYNNPRTYLWADPTINSIVFTHRMVGGTEVEGNSRIAYDVTTDGGTTWDVDVQVYTPTGPDPGTGYPMSAGRYPQGAILNPEGNTDPANAYYSYFICTLDNSNANWGGLAYGSNPLTEVDPPNPTQVNLTSEDGVYYLIPDAFHVTQQGVAWGIDGNQESVGADYVYTGELIINRGEINEDGEVEYEQELYPWAESGEAINDMKVAFAPDGMTGYIVIMTDLASDPVPYTSYHPSILKTTDGGESWSDPIEVQLGGEDGIAAIKNYWPDSAYWAAGYDIDPLNREEVYYNMGFQVDIAVDGSGNLYITGVIAIGDPDGWYPNEGQMATWNLYTKDGGETWNADPLYDNIWLQGDIGAIVQYNRPYISSTYDGHYLFFSWIDSDIEQATQNDRPNIYVVGYDTEDEWYSDVQNVTYFTQAWNRAFYGSQSYYVFMEEAGDMYTCELPFVFTEFSVPGDDTQECYFWYIDGYTMDVPVDVPTIEADAINFTVGQNMPNPATSSTEILVNGQTDMPIQLTVSNMLGQVVYRDVQESRAQTHSFRMNVSDLDAGIYLYTVTVGEKSVTKKMLVD